MVKTNAAIYIRKSSDDGTSSSDDQLHDLTALAKRHELNVVEIYREADGISASHLSTQARPEFERMKADFGTKFQTLIYWKIDRYSRKGAMEADLLCELVKNTPDSRIIDNNGFDATSETIESRRLEIIIASEFARKEVEATQERIIRGKKAQRRNAEYMGGQVPFGLSAVRSVDRRTPTYLVPDPEHVEVIKLMCDLVVNGASCAEVATILFERGTKTARGARWTHKSVGKFLRSPHLIGQRRYSEWKRVDGKRQIVKTDVARDENGDPIQVHDPLIEESLFYKVQACLDARAKVEIKRRQGRKTSQPQKSTKILSGLLRCIGCEMNLYGRVNISNNLHYRCDGGCKQSIDGRLLEDFVADTALGLIGVLASEDSDSPILDEVTKRWVTQFDAGDNARRTKIETEAAKITTRLNKLRDDHYVKGVISDEQFEDLSVSLQAKLMPLEAELAQIPEATPDISPLIDLVGCSEGGELTGDGSVWAGLPKHTQKQVLRCVIDHIEIEPGVKGKPAENLQGRTHIVWATAENTSELANRPDYIRIKDPDHQIKVLTQ
jgi:site-specific DNA recombinase